MRNRAHRLTAGSRDGRQEGQKERSGNQKEFLLQYPGAGKVVRGSGGVRKVRWAIAGKGKSGGVRVIGSV